ncbi:hypothetical protein ILUMI_13415 [Ignelater luminosus]|uniref:Uncharacterized protein n=1 Tax=Ignelater luminosus TaxID=2038154 RepID=A0A8K0CWS4_IGNLU|nr:hypothetical protein ILUMI_13415 [Ignelater luminosus]
MLKLRSALVFLFFTTCIVYVQNRNEDDGSGFLKQPNRNPSDYLSQDEALLYDEEDYLTSRYAPQQQSYQDDLPYVITESRLKKIRSNFMYWYFDLGKPYGGGDWQNGIHDSNSQLHKNFNFQLPFFGFRFNYTRVSINGYLEFSDPPLNYANFPLKFPVRKWPKQNDHSFIGIFYSKCRLGRMQPEDTDKRKEGVYFRLEKDLQSRTDQFGVEVRERVKWDIREGIIGAETFEPRHVIITTWKNISFFGGIELSKTKTNTFQLVLATDEVFTYAIFNYLDLRWTAHTEAFGDTVTGEGGVSAYVGFNAGNGKGSYEYMPHSQASVIRDLTKTGWGNGFPGRHIFKIDEEIRLGSCNKDIDGTNLEFFFAPEGGNMLGGTIVNVTGPCFEPSDRVLCRFDREEVYGTVVNRNRAICVQPRLYTEGYVRFEIAIDPGKYKWKGRYFVENPLIASQKIFFEDYSVHKKDALEIKISWIHRNLTVNENTNVRISLWGYRETISEPEFLFLGQLTNNTPNIGRYTINPAKYRNCDNKNVSDIKFGFLQINLTEPILIDGTDTKITPIIWSRPIPLAWYFAPQWKQEYGINWTETLCDDWIRNDGLLANFTDELPHCPCTLEQALADKGRYLPDMDCDKDANPTCLYNRGAIHCVRTGLPTYVTIHTVCPFSNIQGRARKIGILYNTKK